MRIPAIYTGVRLGLTILLALAPPPASAGGSALPDNGKLAGFQDCEECPPLVPVPPLDEQSPHLLVARHELTWSEYLPSVVEADCPLPSLQDEHFEDLESLADGLPLIYLPPTKIGCFLAWLEKKSGHRYRLPTGAEWEHFARGGVTTRFPWGEELGQNRAAIFGAFNHAELNHRRIDTTDPRATIQYNRNLMFVESFAPNDWGLYDVIGNVSEYVADYEQPRDTCLKVKDPEYCVPIEVRSGGIFVTARSDAGEHVDVIRYTEVLLSGAAQPPGYRFVREATD